MDQSCLNSCQTLGCEGCESRNQSPLCSVIEAAPEIESIRKEATYGKGRRIFSQGERSHSLHLLKSGLVSIEIASHDGTVNTVRLIGPGCVFGHRAFFSDGLYQETALAVEDCVVCSLEREGLEPVLLQHPQMALNLLTQLSKDLKTAQDKWVGQITKSAPARIAEALLFFEDQFMDQPWSRREIAQWAGTTTETVIRNLSQLEKSGIIKACGRRYSILDRALLITKAERV